ncbi:MAG: tRNA 2-thiouridine(34) synthase MnmA [Eubacterium sp.]|nr:tRNA 2-thiouridine(34) synthase MnmA [Eubacterium sp.]
MSERIDGIRPPWEAGSRPKAMVAMSGGVDSSVAAYLTLQQGFETIGVTMKLYDNEMIGEEKCGTCCSLSDVEDARSVANRLGIKYYVFNFEDDFENQVIRRFVSAYENGLTPNPCIDCNRYLKFQRLFRRGQELGQDKIVTGHYARVGFDPGSGRYLLKKAVDQKKDQSYVLYALEQEQLSRAMFPLGEMTKEEARAIAEEQGFINAHKHDSQDICFVPDGDYAGFIRRYTGKDYPPGDFVDREGNVLGTHKGIIRYTIGQRKGLGLALKEPMYVCEKDIIGNKVILGRNEDLFSRVVYADRFNWIACEAPPAPIRVGAKIRYSQKEAAATVTALSEDRVRIEFDEPQRAATAGQAAVLYDGDVVVGGGTICEGD